MIKLTTGRTLAVLALSLLGSASTSFGALLSYTDNALWTSNVSTVSIIGFDVIHLDNNVYIENGVTIQGFVNGLYPSLAVYNVPGSQYFDWGSGAILRGPDNDAGSTFLTMALNSTAVGFDLMTGPDAGIVTVLVNGTDSFDVHTNLHPNRQFIGFTSDTAITSIKLTSPAGYAIRMDNVANGTASVVTEPPPVGDTPEATTLLLCGTGLFSLGFFRRRKA